MQVVYVVLSSFLLIICVALVVMILMQKKRSGMSSTLTGMGGSSSQTFWDKNKKHSAEGKLEKWTKISGAMFMLLVLILNIVY